MQMAIKLDGKALAASIKSELAVRAKVLKNKGIVPELAVVLAGEDPASAIYVRNKIKDCEEVGIESQPYYLPATVTMEELLALVRQLNADPAVHGILVQFPLPNGLSEKLVCETILPSKDVDGFHIQNLGKLAAGEEGFVSCTPAGALRLIELAGPVAGKKAVVIGRSNNVGKPMALLLLNKNATVTVCHSKTPNIAEYTRQADIVVTAVGRAGMLTGDMLKPGAVVADIGISMVDGKSKGDVDAASVEPVAGWLTPMPGGTGPMTRAMLMYNTVLAAENAAAGR